MDADMGFRSGFGEDHIIELLQELQMGTSGSGFSDAELDFIERWAGDNKDDGTFYNERITAAYGIPQEDGREPGEYTWPKLAAMLREQKARGQRRGMELVKR